MSLGTFVDVMCRDYHSCVTIFRYFHQMIPNAANDDKEWISKHQFDMPNKATTSE